MASNETFEWEKRIKIHTLFFYIISVDLIVSSESNIDFSNLEIMPDSLLLWNIFQYGEHFLLNGSIRLVNKF